MKAVGYFAAGSIDRAESLVDLELPTPEAGGHDLRVKVAAVSVNPIDAKMRRTRAPAADRPDVLGWDAVGVVDAVGPDVTGFAVGDRVFYAGAINRPGANAEYHLVDARITGHAPRSLSDAEAAALPLTAITAWEVLFERLGIQEGGGEGRHLLIIGGAGGVGSILIQLARQLTKLTIVASASRTETQDWCREMGAHHVIDHSRPLLPQLQALGIAQVEYIAALKQTQQHWNDIVDAAAPQGRIAMIEDHATPLDIMKLKVKSVSLHWELMFTRSLFQTPDMAEQGRLLSRVAELVDAGRVRSTLAQTLSPINAANLRQVHALIESGRVRGKLVVTGF